MDTCIEWKCEVTNNDAQKNREKTLEKKQAFMKLNNKYTADLTGKKFA